MTLKETLLGLLLGSVVGILVGVLLGESALVRAAVYPYLVAFQSLPKVALAPLFVIWFGFGLTPKVLVAATLTFFPLLVNTMSGVMTVDRDRARLFRSMSASRRQIWLKLLLPSALPSVLAGFELATVLALLGAVLGEFVSFTGRPGGAPATATDQLRHRRRFRDPHGSRVHRGHAQPDRRADPQAPGVLVKRQREESS